MKMNELKSGNIIETRDGNRYVYVNEKVAIQTGQDYRFSTLPLKNYNEDMTYKFNEDYDIIQVLEIKDVYDYNKMYDVENSIWSR